MKQICVLAIVHKNMAFQRYSKIGELSQAFVIFKIPFFKQGIKAMQDLLNISERINKPSPKKLKEWL